MDGGHNQLLEPKLSPMLLVPGVGPHCQGMPYPSVSFKPASGELRECGLPPTSDSHPSQQEVSDIPTLTPDQGQPA